jgi:hypothetical protein
MGASRMGFDLLTKQGWQNLRFAMRFTASKVHPYVWQDTFAQLWCWVVGHDVYTPDSSRSACRRCAHYLPELGKK